MERRLAAILAADVVGYSRLIEADEAGTLAALKSHREALIDPKIAQYHGRIVKLMGDGLLAEFPSAVEAVRCAVEIQYTMTERNADIPDKRRTTYRIGINIGDIVVEDDDIFGDGVNIAARLEGLADRGGICISRAVHTQIADKLDLVFEDLGEQRVKNITKPVMVYRVALDTKAAALVTPVDQGVARQKHRRWLVAAAAAVFVLAVGGVFWWQPWKPDVAPASLERMAFPLPNKPSIAVLPFNNLSGDPAQDYFVDGLTETLIADLSRFRGLFVIARNSTFTYRGKPLKVQQVAEDLGVQYILEGSVQRSAERLRITAQLVDATAGNHLWAESYDRELSDIFAVQDEVTERIVATLGAYQGELAAAARARAKRKDPASFSAYDTFLVGIEHKHRFTQEDNAAAERLFTKATELDPNFAQAYVGLAWIHIQKFWFGWTDAPEQAVAQSREAAEKAIALDPSEAEAYMLLAEAFLANGDFEKGEANYDRALALNPNHADLLASWGYASVLLGEPERAVDFMHKAMRLNPHYPDWYDRGLGTAAYMAGRYEEAIAAFGKVTQHVIQSRLYPAASYARLGRLEEAKAEVAKAIELDPDISIDKFSRIEVYKNLADLERLKTDLRKAGLREHAPTRMPDKPSIAVLPFKNMLDDQSEDYFADGITEDLITDLAKFPGLQVTARTSTSAYKGKALDLRKVGQELGVQYLLEGSVEKGGSKLRVTAQLIDAATGSHIWADRYDRDVNDLFAIRDEIRASIVGALTGHTGAIVMAEVERASRQSSDSVKARDFYYQALGEWPKFNREANARARELLQRSITLDPQNGAAHALLAWTHWRDVWIGWSDDAEVSRNLALETAETAVELDRSNYRGYWALGSALRLYDDYDTAGLQYERAFELNPYDPDLLADWGELLRDSGEFEKATIQLETALALNPNYPDWYLAVLASTYLFAERYDEAIRTSSRIAHPTTHNRATLAVSLAKSGRLNAAKAQIAKLLAQDPSYSIIEYLDWPGWERRNPEMVQSYVDALRRAGLPE